MSFDNSEIFKVEEVASDVYRILCSISEMVYLINGSERSVLIDAGCGVGSLKDFISQLTDKPIDVILSHGHIDHVMGAGEFENVYLNDKDWSYGKLSNLKKRSHKFVSSFNPELGEALPIEDIISCEDTVFKPLNPGDMFDLGGINLEIFNLGGHSPGNVAILIKEKRLLFLGDGCSNVTFLFFDDSLSIDEYKKNLEDLKVKTDGLYDKVLFSHLAGQGPAATIEDVIEVCDDILNDKAEDIPFSFLKWEALIAKSFDWDEDNRYDYIRKDGKYGNVVYRKKD